MRFVLIGILVTCVITYSRAQKPSLITPSKKAWLQGSITLPNAETLPGSLYFDDNSHVVTMMVDGNQRLFNAKNALAFAFLDSGSNKERQFLSLEFEDPLNDIKRPLFFELLHQFPTFAVVEYTSPSQSQNRSEMTNAVTAPGSLPGSSNVPIDVQIRVLCFLNENGNLVEYLREETQIMGKNKILQQTKSKLNGKDELQKVTDPYFDKLKKYASEQKLSFRKRDEVFKILEYYGTLVR